MRTIVTRLSFLVFTFSGFAQGSQLIVNGGFEMGNFTGWTIANQPNNTAGNFFVSTANTTPVSGKPDAGPASGVDYAVADGFGPGVRTLSQTFMVSGPISTVTLSYSLFVNSFAPSFVNAAGLDYTAIPNQYATVDILKGSSVVQNFYLGADPTTNNPYKNYSFNITNLVGAGGTFTLRFAEVNNVDILNMGVDNVSILTVTTGAVPEPSTLAFVFLALSGSVCVRRFGKQTV